ncbi:MAG: hypothetical protein LBM67_04650 [Lentimicrobiaceae bacterium]|jgi:hypothetical protein|nr:hypothetical protein [Lentimicrobiaceae bacterium]
MENDDFKKQVEELFFLFKKILEQSPDPDEMSEIDRLQMEQIKLFLSKYDRLKDQTVFEIMGDPDPQAKKMLSLLIKQLREQLGVEVLNEMYQESPSVIDNIDDIAKSIDDIDFLLRSDTLSQEEIDRLLDERSKLIDKQNENPL